MGKIGISICLRRLFIWIFIIKILKAFGINVCHIEVRKYKNAAELKKLSLLNRMYPEITISIHFTTKAKWGDEGQRKYWVNCMGRCMEELVDVKNIKWINIHLGECTTSTTKQYLENTVKSIQDILNFNSEILLTVENSFQSSLQKGTEVGVNIDHFLYIFRKIKSDRLRLIIDTGHLLISEQNIWQYICLLNKIIAIHCHDSFGYCLKNMVGDPHFRVGKGIFPWKELKEFLSNKEVFLVAENRSIIDTLVSIMRLRKIF